MFSFDIDTGRSLSNQKLEEARKRALAKRVADSAKCGPSRYLRLSGWLITLLEALEGRRLARSVAATETLPCTDALCA